MSLASDPDLTPRKNLRGAALATLIGIAVLLALGAWQLARREWKSRILAQVDAAEHAAPVRLDDAVTSPFAKVIVRGTIGPEWALYGAEVREAGGVSRMGSGLLEILHRGGALPVLVDLGWVADGGRPVLGPAEVTGYVRAVDHGSWLSAPDDPAGRHFYTLNPRVIGATLGVRSIAPFTIVALGPAAIGGAQPADALPRPPNNHLQYAFTWFGLAAALLAVFMGYARGGRAR